MQTYYIKTPTTHNYKGVSNMVRVVKHKYTHVLLNYTGVIRDGGGATQSSSVPWAPAY
jgi:hypothetical protein